MWKYPWSHLPSLLWPTRAFDAAVKANKEFSFELCQSKEAVWPKILLHTAVPQALAVQYLVGHKSRPHTSTRKDHLTLKRPCLLPHHSSTLLSDQFFRFYSNIFPGKPLTELLALKSLTECKCHTVLAFDRAEMFERETWSKISLHKQAFLTGIT